MTGAAEEAKLFEWEGGTLEELLALLGEAALTVRLEALRPGSGQPVGRLEVIAGGVLESSFGSERGDEALAALKRIPGLRYRLEPALPHPDEGTLERLAPAEGLLAERPATALMRYCEDYALTCALELDRGSEHARISYRRGEIVRTLVDGSESPERLPDVIGWSDGRWKIVLPQLTLPRPKKVAAPAPVPKGPSSGTLFGFPAPVIPGVTTAARPGSEPAPVAAAPAPVSPPPPSAPVDAASPVPSAAAARPPARVELPPAEPTPAVTAPAAVSALPPLPEPPAISPPLPAPPTAAPPGREEAPASFMPVREEAPASFMPVRATPTVIDQPRFTPMTTDVDIPVPVTTPLPPPSMASPSPAPLVDETRATPPPMAGLPLAPARPRSPAPPRGFTGLPLVVHVLLGVVLGTAIVAGYWAYLTYAPAGLPGLR